MKKVIKSTNQIKILFLWVDSDGHHTDLFLYSYESEFLDNMIRSGHRKLARSFNLCYRHIDDLIVFNNKKFGDYAKEIYP